MDGILNGKWKRGGMEKLDLSLLKSRKDKIILFYIEFGKGSKILMDGILNGKWKRGRWKSWT